MAQKMSTLLHLFLDFYEKEPSTLEFLLQETSLLEPFNNEIPLIDQYKLLQRAHEKARRELLAKTLVETPSFQFRHSMLREQLAGYDLETVEDTPYQPLPDVALDAEELQVLHEGGLTIENWVAFIAAKHGLTPEQYRTRLAESLTRERLTTTTLDSEILRFFADRIDQITNAVKQFDATEFNRLLPEGLVAPFRELHINAMLGNYGTACILCGSLLERTLQDLLQSDSLLNDLIKQAKRTGLLTDKNRRFADRIRDDRNNAAHGKVKFTDITSAHTWDTVSCTRKLVSDLYKNRVSQDVKE